MLINSYSCASSHYLHSLNITQKVLKTNLYVKYEIKLSILACLDQTEEY